MKSLTAISYILALTLAGFFLWVIRGFIRGLRQKDQLPSELPDSLRGPAPATETDVAGKVPVDWPCNLFLQGDDVEYPGRLEALTPAGAFLRCSAPLRAGRAVSLYLEVPGGGTCLVSAKILWVGTGRGRQPVAQLRFEGLAAEERELLMKAARGASETAR